MIRLDLMLLHCSHHSLHSSLPHHGFLGDPISVPCKPGLPLWIYEISDFFSFNLTPSSFSPFLHLSIYHSQGCLGRKSINPSLPSFTAMDRWGGRRGRREKEREGQMAGDPRVGFHNIFKVLWAKDGEILLVMYADVLDDRPLGCIFNRCEGEAGAAEVGVWECRRSNCGTNCTFVWRVLWACYAKKKRLQYSLLIPSQL